MPVNLRDVGLCAEDLSRMDSVKVDDMSRQLTAPAAKLSAHVIYFREVPAGLIFSDQQ